MRPSSYALVAFALIAVHDVSANTFDCTGISTATPITTSGVYCLTADITYSTTTGSAISISSSDVVFDLNGHKINGSGAGTGTAAYGISVSGKKNVTIRNGAVKGFFKG